MDSQPIELLPGLTIESLLDDQIICMTITNSTREVIDKFVEAIKDIQQDWPSDRIAYFIFDFSGSFAGFNTPYGRERVNELLKWRTDIKSYGAMIMPKTFLLQIARTVLKNMRRSNSLNQIFFTREDALIWLTKQLTENSKCVREIAS